MVNELLAFVNFKYKINKMTAKVLIGERIQEEERYALNWREYLNCLEGLDIEVNVETRPFFHRYQNPRPDTDFFHTFMIFQKELQEMLDDIIRTGTIPLAAWQTIFRESEKISEVVVPRTRIDQDVRPEDLTGIRFEKLVTADTYRAFLFGRLRDLIISRQVFRLKKCPECRKYFLDVSKNGKRKYCSAQECGRKAKLVGLYRWRRPASGQAALAFTGSGDNSAGG
ncbi:MAG: CGNR zinc finger domain-containing protein [Thermodesulfobacteriota bacterium]